MSKNKIKFFLVKRANEQERDQLDVFNRLIKKWTEHDEPIITRALQANLGKTDNNHNQEYRNIFQHKAYHLLYYFTYS